MSGVGSVTAAVSITLFLAHAWLVFGHRQILGSARGDRSEDPVFTTWRMRLGLGYLTGVLAAFCALRIRDRPAVDFFLISGATIFLAGYALRLWAIQALGKLFTFEIGIRAEHRIVESGPYRLIRHPSYTGYLLVLAGICVAYASRLCALLTLAPTFGFLLLRIRAEEAMLRKHFGKRFVDYAKKTKRLIPWVY